MQWPCSGESGGRCNTQRLLIAQLTSLLREAATVRRGVLGGADATLG